MSTSRLYRLLWWLGLALLTYGLVSPQPPKVGAALLPTEWMFWAAKSVHVGAYGFLAATGLFLSPSRRVALLTLAGLVGHGMLTEYAQTQVEGRFGSWQDVGIDSAGILLGTAVVAVILRRWASPPAPSSSLAATATEASPR